MSIPEPPTDRHAFLAWAEQHGVLRELMRPAKEVLTGRLGTLGDLCIARDDEAREWARSRAAWRAGELARARLRASPLPEGALGVLARRLGALSDGLAYEPLRFVPARPVELHAPVGALAHTRG